MFQVRVHGRGGQGVVTAAELLSVAAFEEGKHAQAFPSFGSERMGAPVTAFARIDGKAIRLREPVARPDALIVQDPTLLQQVDLFSGLPAEGYLLINTGRSLADLGIESLLGRHAEDNIVTVPASEIAMRAIGRPLPNAALLGAFAALTGVVKLASLEVAIRRKFGAKVAEANVVAAREAYAAVCEARKEEAVRVEAD